MGYIEGEKGGAERTNPMEVGECGDDDRMGEVVRSMPLH